jgi:hypothetical protein
MATRKGPENQYGPQTFATNGPKNVDFLRFSLLLNTYQTGAAPQRKSTNPPDRDPGTRRIGECSNGFDKRGTRIGEVVWRETAQARHRADGTRSRRSIELRLTRGARAAVAGKSNRSTSTSVNTTKGWNKSPKRCIPKRLASNKSRAWEHRSH